MGRSRSGSTPLFSYRGLSPTYSAAAVDFARLDGNPTGSSNANGGSSNSISRGGGNEFAPQAPIAVDDPAPLRVLAPAAQSSQAPTAEGTTIRFVQHIDPRLDRPSLQFETVTRTVTSAAPIRIGRYSEREDRATSSVKTLPPSAPVGFKSKVVSRRHCELWYEDGKWWIKDVHSSSGTFLNRVRLSPANIESKPYRLNDLDVVQLGIDFKGGEEMIFRCVRIRVEIGREWQKSLNSYNITAHKNLLSSLQRDTSRSGDQEGAVPTSDSNECAICLYSVAPRQSLFVAPCAHTWHYKCIRPLLNGKDWPRFCCPNCRAVSNLEEDVDLVNVEQWTKIENEHVSHLLPPPRDHSVSPSGRQEQSRGVSEPMEVDDEASPGRATIAAMASVGTSNRKAGAKNDLSADTGVQPFESPPVLGQSDLDVALRSAQSPNIDVPAQRNHALRPSTPGTSRGLEAGTDVLAGEGPMTPRNDAGPFVFDGSAGRGAE